MHVCLNDLSKEVQREKAGSLALASFALFKLPLSPLPTFLMSNSEHEAATPPSPVSPRSVLSPSSTSSDDDAAATAGGPRLSSGHDDRVVRNGKLYSKKKANLPYLKAHTWREREARRRPVTKESSPPHERTEQVSRSILRISVVMVLGTLLLSRMMTESWTFGYKGRWTNINNWIPRPVRPSDASRYKHQLTQL